MTGFAHDYCLFREKLSRSACCADRPGRTDGLGRIPVLPADSGRRQSAPWEVKSGSGRNCHCHPEKRRYAGSARGIRLEGKGSSWGTGVRAQP